MNSRAGTIFQRQDSASHKKRGTILFEKKKKSKDLKIINADNPHDNRKSDQKEQNDSDKFSSVGQQATFSKTNPNVELNEPTPEKPPPTLEEVSKNAARVVCRVKTVFPFVLFPDEVIADEEKVTIIIGSFFNSGYMRSIMLHDISTISIDTSLLFATLTIIDRNYVQDAMVVRFLKKEDGFRIRRIVMGLVIANQNKVNTSDYSLEELREYAEKIGGSQSKVPGNI